MTNRIVITGGGGQLARALIAELERDPNVELVVWTHADQDIADPAVAEQVAKASPNIVVNCAAWTKVDAAEADPTPVYAANALGPLHLAQGCRLCGADLVQVSTNEIYAGEPGRTYYEYDIAGPRSVYARSKLAGEHAARQVLDRLYVVRVAWLFGPGGENFPTKIAAAADRHGSLRVVEDEFGNPTYAPDVARAIRALIAAQRYGIYHLVNSGSASRFAFAAEVLRRTGRGDVALMPIALADWPRPAPPPSHAVLVNQAAAALGITLRPWQDALAEYLQLEQEKFALPRPTS